MKIKFILLLVAVLLSCVVFAEEQTQTDTPVAKETAASVNPADSILSISFSGNENMNDDFLKDTISTKVGDVWDNTKIQEDISALAMMGVFSSITYKKEERAGGIALTFELIENPKISNIEIINPEPLTAEAVLAVLKTKPGFIFNENTAREDFNAIRELYGNEGYLAYVTEDADLNPETGTFTIPILVYKVGKITVTGNKKTKTNVILREMTLKPGDYYNVKTLRNKDYNAINDLGYFESIGDPEPSEGENGTLNINIPVKEKNTGTVNIGLGYSQTQKLVGTLRVGDSNFLGTGQSVSATWEQATRKGFRGKGSWELNYGNPWLDSNHTSLDVSVYNKLVYRFNKGAFGSSALNSDTNYGERHEGTIISLARPFGKAKNSSVGLGFKYDNVETNPNLLYEKENWKIMQNGVVTSVDLSFDNDTRDSRTNTKEGTYKSICFVGGHIDGSEYTPLAGYNNVYYKTPFKGNYWKTFAEYKTFFCFRKKDPQITISTKDLRPVVALRLKGGIAGGEVPFFEQFFVGGTDTVRGFDDDRFWGKKYFVVNAEYRHPVLDYLTLVLFADAGDAWGSNSKFLTYKDLSQNKNPKIHFGYGLGGRFITPLGAMSLDVGFSNDGTKLHFSMGQSF